jgi:hypothetical protein
MSQYYIDLSKAIGTNDGDTIAYMKRILSYDPTTDKIIWNSSRQSKHQLMFSIFGCVLLDIVTKYSVTIAMSGSPSRIWLSLYTTILDFNLFSYYIDSVNIGIAEYVVEIINPLFINWLKSRISLKGDICMPKYASTHLENHNLKKANTIIADIIQRMTCTDNVSMEHVLYKIGLTRHTTNIIGEYLLQDFVCSMDQTHNHSSMMNAIYNLASRTMPPLRDILNFASSFNDDSDITKTYVHTYLAKFHLQYGYRTYGKAGDLCPRGKYCIIYNDHSTNTGSGYNDHSTNTGSGYNDHSTNTNSGYKVTCGYVEHSTKVIRNYRAWVRLFEQKRKYVPEVILSPALIASESLSTINNKLSDSGTFNYEDFNTVTKPRTLVSCIFLMVLKYAEKNIAQLIDFAGKQSEFSKFKSVVYSNGTEINRALNTYNKCHLTIFDYVGIYIYWFEKVMKVRKDNMIHLRDNRIDCPRQIILFVKRRKSMLAVFKWYITRLNILPCFITKRHDMFFKITRELTSDEKDNVKHIMYISHMITSKFEQQPTNQERHKQEHSQSLKDIRFNITNDFVNRYKKVLNVSREGVLVGHTCDLDSGLCRSCGIVFDTCDNHIFHESHYTTLFTNRDTSDHQLPKMDQKNNIILKSFLGIFDVYGESALISLKYLMTLSQRIKEKLLALPPMSSTADIYKKYNILTNIADNKITDTVLARLKYFSIIDSFHTRMSDSLHDVLKYMDSRPFSNICSYCREGIANVEIPDGIKKISDNISSTHVCKLCYNYIIDRLNTSVRKMNDSYLGKCNRQMTRVSLYNKFVASIESSTIVLESMLADIQNDTSFIIGRDIIDWVSSQPADISDIVEDYLGHLYFEGMAHYKGPIDALNQMYGRAIATVVKHRVYLEKLRQFVDARA